MAARLIGRLLIAILVYLSLAATVFASSVVLFRNGVVADLPWMLPIQRKLYERGGWRIWQAQPECVDFDPRLIYAPRLGTCRFANLEFDTMLTFSREGRETEDSPADGRGIAVVGDSFAMGWGVEDAETYSAELERRTGRRVYNLAVSSYGTARELMRLTASGLLDAVDTVVIAYCENDLDENRNFEAPSLAEAQEKFSEITGPLNSGRGAYLKYLYKVFTFALRFPFSEISRMVLDRDERKDFAPHYGPLMSVIANTPGLREKRVVVIYTNASGAGFRNFPSGTDREMSNVVFVDLDLDAADFYPLDSHLNPRGHERIGRQLAQVLHGP